MHCSPYFIFYIYISQQHIIRVEMWSYSRCPKSTPQLLQEFFDFAHREKFDLFDNSSNLFVPKARLFAISVREVRKTLSCCNPPCPVRRLREAASGFL